MTKAVASKIASGLEIGQRACDNADVDSIEQSAQPRDKKQKPNRPNLRSFVHLDILRHENVVCAKQGLT